MIVVYFITGESVVRMDEREKDTRCWPSGGIATSGKTQKFKENFGMGENAHVFDERIAIDVNHVDQCCPEKIGLMEHHGERYVN